MSKLLNREIRMCKKKNISILDSYVLCKKIKDNLTIVEFLELWKRKKK